MQNRFETFMKFDNNFLSNKIKEFYKKILIDFSDINSEVKKTRFSQNIHMSVSDNKFIVDVHEFKYLTEMKEIASLTYYKSINNDYLYISSENFINI